MFVTEWTSAQLGFLIYSDSFMTYAVYNINEKNSILLYTYKIV